MLYDKKQNGVLKMNQLDAKRIGQILKNRRNQLGYTQEFAAEKSGISYSYYTKIERGEQLPSLEVCIMLARIFRLSLDSWLLDASPKNVTPEALDLLNCLEEIDKKSIEDVQLLIHKASLLAK